MKKSKLYGSRLIEDNKQTITPELVTLESTDDVTNLTFDRGNILDAASIKQYQAATSDDLTTKYNTLSENVTTNSNDIITINTQLTTTAESINSINANITTINNSLVDYGIALEYVDNKLILKNKNSDTLSSIDLSIMTEDTYLDTVTFSNNKLIFTWNEGSSKKPITIDLSRLKDKDGNELSVGNILAKSKLLFLSKNDSDTAKGLITFMKGVRIGNYTSESGGVIDVDQITGQTYLEVDKLKVRMKAYFETLSIVNEQSIAGKWTISPGGSIQCTRVNITPESNYKCYFTNTQDNVKIENRFAVNDLAISKDFNIKTVESQSATNHYYWRKVIEVGEDYIVLSKTDCDTGSDEPNVGDVICQLGNTTDVDRQNALVLSSVDDQSPCINLYSGINAYSLADKEYVSYGVNKTTNKAFMNVYGDMYFGDRPTADNNYTGVSFIKYDSTNKKVTIKGELDVQSTVGGTNINQYIKNNSLSDTDVNSLIANSTVVADLQSQIDGSIETFFYSGVPTLSNLPASSWVLVATETNKETYSNHIGDLYYDKDTGKAYRFMLDGNTQVYSWVLITDTDITKALSDSADALSTANVKKRIFYGTPIVPYDLGDLWVNATYPVGTTKTDVVNNQYYKEILYCTTAKALGSSFSITDWNLSNNYTNMSNSIITDLNGYAYIKAALSNDTQTTGGLILSSLIALRDADGDVQSGINGILSDTALGKGIATWWGGKMIDGGFTPDITTTTVQDYATSLIRFNGSGYLANGAISWDTNGKIHADPTSFFVGPTSIGIIASLFSTIPINATSYSQVTKIHPTKPFDTLSADTITATTFIGELQGNAATATKLKTARTIWGQSFDGSWNVSGRLSLDESSVYWKEPNFGDQFAIVPSFPGTNDSNILCFQSAVGDAGTTPSLSTKMVITGQSGNVGIGTTSPAYKLDVSGNGHFTSDLYLDATVGTSNFVSRTTGWRADSNGNADFRNIYADELRVQAFTADISQALAGSDYLTKSVSKLSANFVVPSVNSTVRIIVDDIEGMPATRCFSNGDYIRFRAFNRTSGLTIANVWGTVVLDTTYGSNGFLNGTQAYTFTCKATSGAGLTVFKGSEVLDYGTSGSGLIARTTLDAMGSPYEQIATWVNDPSNGNNYTVHARLGNLNGIANCSGYGLYTDNGFFTGKIIIGDLTKSGNYLSFDNVNGLQIKLGGTSVATTTDIIIPCGNWESGTSYLKNSLVTFNNQTFVSTINTSDCPIVILTNENGDYLVNENGNYITYTDENGNVTYNPSWKAYSSSEALEQDISKFKKETSTTFEILNDEINSKVSSATYDALGRRVSKAESSIDQTAEAVKSKVSSTDYTGNTIASLINQTATTVAIQASKINLLGAVTFSSFDSSTQATINGKADSAAHGNFTYIDGNSVYTGTLTAGQVNAVAINANSITTGTINSDRIDADAIVTKALTSSTITATNATITNLNLNNGTIYNLRSPWEKAYSFETAHTDNIMVFGPDIGTIVYNLSWESTDIGRFVRIAETSGIESGSTEGIAELNAPTGKYFYVNGNKRSEIRLGSSIIELVGIGFNNVFYGWVVLNVRDLMSKVQYGKSLNILAHGLVTATSINGDPRIDYRMYNDGYINGVQYTMTAKRIDSATYRVTFPTQWELNINYIVMLTGVGYSLEDNVSPTKATLIKNGDGYFDVRTSDDATVNAGSFEFQIFNYYDI